MPIDKFIYLRYIHCEEVYMNGGYIYNGSDDLDDRVFRPIIQSRIDPEMDTDNTG